jgi:glucose-1-phosphate thymidylyltransferase
VYPAAVVGRVELRLSRVEIARALIFPGTASNPHTRAPVAGGPQQLVPVANKPILFHKLEALQRAGVLEALIVVDSETGSAIRGAVGDGAPWGLNVDYVQCAVGAALGGVLAATRSFTLDEPVLIEPGDALLLEHMRTHITAFAGERLDTLALRVPSADGPAYGGYLLSRRAIMMLANAPRAKADPLARVRGHGGSVRIQDVDGCRPCHGGAESLLEANRRVLQRLEGNADGAELISSRLQGAVLVHPTARLERTLVRGPAIIGAGVRLTDAYVGPYTSIGDRVTIEGAEIEHSIVFEDAQLKFVGTRIETSVIGRGARVTRSFELPSAMRLTIGDDAEVSIA